MCSHRSWAAFRIIFFQGAFLVGISVSEKSYETRQTWPHLDPVQKGKQLQKGSRGIPNSNEKPTFYGIVCNWGALPEICSKPSQSLSGPVETFGVVICLQTNPEMSARETLGCALIGEPKDKPPFWGPLETHHDTHTQTQTDKHRNTNTQ